MKKIMTWLLTMIVILSASVTAFAAESNPDGENRQIDIGVYARYIDNTQWNTIPVDENGKASVVLPDGTEITVSGALKPGWQLVIDQITEKDALDWIGDVLDGKAKDLSPVHIYFIDGCGNTKAVDGVTVTAKDGSLTFTTDGSPYYVLGEKVSGGTSSTGETPSNPGDSRQTGDTGRIWLWLAILTVSGMVLFGIVLYRKRKIRR